MKSKKNKCLKALALGFGLASFASATQAGYLYVSDYGKSELDRYQYTYDKNTNTVTSITPYGINGNTSNAYFLGGGSAPVKEGIHGTNTDIILVGGSHGSAATVLSRYTFDGKLIGTIPVNFSAYNGGNVGIGNALVTSDGKYMYAPLEAGNAVVKISLANGAIVNSFAFTGAHDVALAANGDVYVANYNASGAKVIRLDANLGNAQNLVTSSNYGGTGGFRPSGLSVAADGSLYVNNNTRGGYDSVLHYTLSGSTATYDSTKSYIGSSTNNSLEFTFGSDIGPDGKVYIAALGGGGNNGFNTRAGYQDGIYALNPLTQTVIQAILGHTEGGANGPSGLSAPKYLQWDINFSTADDAGYLPEPGTLPLMAGVLAVGLGRRWTKRKQGS